MKLTIGDYEIEIKAKKKGQNRFSQKETLNYLCSLEGMFYREGTHLSSKYPILAKWYNKVGLEIHDALDEKGFYDDLKDDSLEKFN